MRPIRHSTLLLENYEHVVAACASLVGHLLDRCPALQALATKESAEALCVSPHTVQTHTISIFGKLGVANRCDAAALAVRRGLALPPSRSAPRPSPSAIVAERPSRMLAPHFRHHGGWRTAPPGGC